MPEPTDYTAPQSNDRPSAGQIRPQGSSPRPQPGRRNRTCHRIAAAKRCRLRHHFGRTISRNRGSCGHPPCGNDGSKAHPGKARFSSTSHLLYRSLHLRLLRIFELRNATLGSGNCGLHRKRRSGGLALLQDGHSRNRLLRFRNPCRPRF